MKIRVLLISICLLVSLRSLSLAQQNVTSATLSGRIEDTRGAVVGGANVTATNLETNQRLTTTTDYDGRYRFPYLRTGTYDLTVEAVGFAGVSRQITVSVGQSLELQVTLEVEGVSAHVDVGSEVGRLTNGRF